MVKIEERAQQDRRLPPFYRRYVDDTVAIFSSTQESESFLRYLNSIHPSLTFTCEVEEFSTLSFLGMSISHEGNKFSTSVHRKSTNKGLLLHYRSHVDSRYKKSLLKTMLHRAYHLCSSWYAFHQECAKLEDIFTRLEYPKALIQHSINKLLSKHHESDLHTITPTGTDTFKTTRLVLPYISDRHSGKLRAVLIQLGKRLHVDIRPVFTSCKLRNHLQKTEAKSPLVSRSRVVYMYTCACDKRYVGFTNRHLHERIAEHHRNSSAIFRHCQDSHECTFCEDNFKILAKCGTKAECMLRESIEIYFRRPELNGKDEYSNSVLYRIRS